METKKIQDYSDVAVTNLDPEKAKIVNERGVELQRLRKQVDIAIKKAEELGRSDMVKKLKARGQQLDTLLRGKTFKELSDGGQIGGDPDSSKSANSRAEPNTEDQAKKNTAEEENNKEEQGLETKKEKNSDDESEVDTDNEETQSNDEASTKPDSSSNNEKENTNEVGSENNTVTDGDIEDSIDDADDDTNSTGDDVDSDTDSTGDDESTTDKSDETLDDSETENNDQQQTNQQQNSSKIDKDADTDQENSDNSDDSRGSDQADEDDPVKDIFNRPENTKQQLGSQGKMSKKESRDPTIDEIIQELQSISQKGRQGVARALKDILSNRGVNDFSESLGKKVLKEAIEDKALEDIDDEEFSDFVNTILDEINNVTPITYSDPDERKVKVKQAMENNLETRDIEMEQEMQVRADKRRKRANQPELDKYTNYRPINEFYVDLYRTIADQVKQVEIDNQSYDEINPEYDDDVIMKADITQYEQRQEKPSIDFFFDVSSSWENSDVELGKRFVASLKEFVDRDELELNIYYFSDIVDQDLDLARSYGGTTAWTKILDTIKSNNAKNVVVMTDGDMDKYAARSGQKCLVEGVVWYIWKIGGYYTTGAQELPKYLKGMQGTTQYSFNAEDTN